MGVNISSKTDYSALFSSLNNSSSRNSGIGNLNSMISSGMANDYASIKNGSYGKLMKAYYAKDGASDEVSKLADKKKEVNSNTKEATELTDVKSATSSLEKKTNELLNADFDKKEDLYESVKGVVDEYNDVLNKAGKTDIKSIASKSDNLISLSDRYKDDLKEIGITIGKDNKLSINKDDFEKADKSKVKDLFGGIGSYGYSVSNQATIIGNQAQYESLRADTYTAGGTFSQGNAAGNMLNGMI